MLGRTARPGGYHRSDYGRLYHRASYDWRGLPIGRGVVAGLGRGEPHRSVRRSLTKACSLVQCNIVPGNTSDPLTEADFLALVEKKRATALAMVGDRRSCSEAWDAAGFAVEYALKALIMRRRRLNAWPQSRDEAPELWSHDLRALLREAGIATTEIPKDLRPAFATALSWSREQAYINRRMPRAVARAMVKAVFDEGRVIEWLRTR